MLDSLTPEHDAEYIANDSICGETEDLSVKSARCGTVSRFSNLPTFSTFSVTERKMKRVALVLFLFLVPVLLHAQSNDQKKSACDNDMTFCWYGDESRHGEGNGSHRMVKTRFNRA